MNEKIHDDHLQRAAYVYVRQSCPHQVRHHLEGQRRQYALADRARDLGFARVSVIDDDLGKSGSGSQDRPGFSRLLTAVCQGQVGAVLAMEASRLARNNRDWHHLIDLCALTDTVLVDDDGIYDPRSLNDRLLLGLKGSMAEFELGLMRQRARAAFLDMVKRGLVMWEVPVGYVRADDHGVEMIPDRQVQEAIYGVFRKFRELSSARQTLLWYREENVPLPQLALGSKGREVSWAIPEGGRILQILNNPCYAGAFAYGRTVTRTVANGDAKKTVRREKPQEEWAILILDHHPGYIRWEEYLHNRQILEGNVARRKGEPGGAAKGGGALLSGLLRCGRCGRKLTVAYSGSTGRVPSYHCQGERIDRGSAECLCVGSLRVDRAVTNTVLEAIQPTGIEAAVAVMERTGQEEDENRKSLQLALEKARYEARRAQRQYDAVDPDNRLVAGELEARWNESLRKVAELEDRIAALGDRPPPLTEQQKDRLFALAADLPVVWNHPEAPVELKKRILRTVLTEVVIDSKENEHVLWLHWQGGIHTELRVQRNGRGKHRYATDEKVMELIQELSKVCDDRAMTGILNRLGYRTPHGKPWRSQHVANVRYYYRLPNFPKCRDWVTLEQAAKELHVSDTLIKRLIRQKVLPAKQVVKYAPWIIRREDLASSGVKRQIQAARGGYRLPQIAMGQQELPMK
jgi:DNA invertase Pin-like site-specific DNA recombinase